MILILSESSDYSTSQVIEWLRHWNKEFLRIDSHKLLEISSIISNNQNHLVINNLPVSSINRVWYRRGFVCVAYDPFPLTSLDLNKNIRSHLIEEIKTLQEYLYKTIERLDPLLLSSVSNASLNKMTVLNVAIECGLEVPDTIVTNQKSVALDFLSNYETCIIKSMNENFMFMENTTSFIQYTQIVNSKEIESNYDEYFFPAIIQEYIDKKLDVRTFVLNDQLFSMAIFSQENSKTEVDFRNYDYENFNRCIPFKLPQEVENSILRLFGKLNLRTGSVDIVYSKDKEFYFLEINPVGQFGMVSYPCNYMLEKKVAEFLSL